MLDNDILWLDLRSDTLDNFIENDSTKGYLVVYPFKEYPNGQIQIYKSVGSYFEKHYLNLRFDDGKTDEERNVEWNKFIEEFYSNDDGK